jgi:hypothetical protein
MGEDMLQMALRLATEMTEPVDLESSLDSAAKGAGKINFTNVLQVYSATVSTIDYGCGSS